MNKWYVINTKANNEILVMKRLKNQKYNIFCPVYLSLTRHARKFKKIIRPFFPGYLFVSIDIQNQSWIFINRTVGVKRILSDGKSPIALRDTIINELYSMQNEEGIIETVNADRYKIGQKIIINDGPFKGSKGLFNGLSAGQRVEILLNMLGRNVTVRFNPLQISAI